jgi:hypothetical protein
VDASELSKLEFKFRPTVDLIELDITLYKEDGIKPEIGSTVKILSNNVGTIHL